MISNSIVVEIADSPEQAPKYGNDFKLLKIEKAIVVCKGTQTRRPTVDLQLVDSDGNQYVIMATGLILEQLAAVVSEARKETAMH